MEYAWKHVYQLLRLAEFSFHPFFFWHWDKCVKLATLWHKSFSENCFHLWVKHDYQVVLFAWDNACDCLLYWVIDSLSNFFPNSEQGFPLNWSEEDGGTWAWWTILPSRQAHVQLGQDETSGAEDVSCCVLCLQHWCWCSYLCCHFPAEKDCFWLGLLIFLVAITNNFEMCL